MTVYWTGAALGHLRGIYEFIAQHSPVYAQRVVDRLTRRSTQIATFPNSGRLVPEFQRVDIREVIEGPYRLIYRVGRSAWMSWPWFMEHGNSPGPTSSRADPDLVPPDPRMQPTGV